MSLFTFALIALIVFTICCIACFIVGIVKKDFNLICTGFICIFLILGTGIYLLTTSKADLCPTCHHQYQTYATYKYCPICDAIVQKQIG